MENKVEETIKPAMYYNPVAKSGMRNSICICGSGKKIKKCCGKDRVISHARLVEIKKMMDDKLKTIVEELKGISSIIDKEKNA